MGNAEHSRHLSSTGLSPATAPLSNGLRPQRRFLTVRTTGRWHNNTPTTPEPQRLPAITRPRFSLFRFRSPLLSESRLFSLPVGTEMFHFPTFPPAALCVQAEVTGHDSSWVSPFGHPRINARLPTPQGISQAPTSFIGSRCQGIHHVPLTTCPQQTTNTHKHPTTPPTAFTHRQQHHHTLMNCRVALMEQTKY